ncbi:hypothetical protein V8F20_009073 [Naviculisporaceae sp. PSN 640]
MMSPKSPNQSSNGQQSTSDYKTPPLTSFSGRPDINPSNPSAPIFVEDKVESRIEYLLADDSGFDYSSDSPEKRQRWVAHMDVRISCLPHQRSGSKDQPVGGTDSELSPGSGASNEVLRQLMTEGFSWSFRENLIQPHRELTYRETEDHGLCPDVFYGGTIYHMTSGISPSNTGGNAPTLEWEAQLKVFEEPTENRRGWKVNTVTSKTMKPYIQAARAFNEDGELVYLYSYKYTGLEYDKYRPALYLERLGMVRDLGDNLDSSDWWDGLNGGSNFNHVLGAQEELQQREPKGFFPSLELHKQLMWLSR